MTDSFENNGDAPLRRTVYVLLLIVAGSIVAGRIAVVRSSTGEVPFLSANDRSRWCTISSLVDDGTYAIDRQVNYREPLRKRRVWSTIDLVRHRGPDGQQHYYSSKPPLYPTMIAAVYAAFKGITGAEIFKEPFLVGRWLTVIVNLLPMLAYFALMIAIIERFGKTNYGRLLAATAITCGTLLVPFAISINNHLPAAISSAVALYCVLSLRTDFGGTGRNATGLCFIAGVGAGFAAANELPALSMTCLWAVVILANSGLRATTVYAAGVVCVAIAFFGTNLYAHGCLRPPYMHRGDGELIGVVATSNDVPAVADVAAILSTTGVDNIEDLQIRDTTKTNLLEVWDPSSQMRYSLRRVDDQWRLSQWDDWYEYEGTYWQDKNRTGVDKGESSRWLYAFNATFGHHGIFSLTPVWLLCFAGAFAWIRKSCDHSRNIALAIACASLVCFAFYIARPLIDRNYGGVSCAFRWMLWFIPLWLWLLLPAADSFANRKLTRGIGYAMLTVSIFSVVCNLENPWQHPWIYRYWDYLGWIAY